MNTKTYKVFTILLIINIGMFLLQIILGDTFTRLLVLTPSEVLIKPWTLITSMFLHGSPGHLLFNMYALLIFGGLIEQRIGSKRFLLAYMIGGIFAGLLYSTFSTISALGASGAIMTILGLAIMLLPDLKVLFFFVIPMSLRTAGIIFAAIDILGLFNPESGIAHLAHLGGLAIGLIYGYYLIKKRNNFAKKFFKAPIRPKRNNKENTIEMTDEDIEEYLRNGRI